MSQETLFEQERDKEKQEYLHIWTHEQSKIRFLHTMLEKQEWRARIVDPDNDPSRLRAIANEMKSAGVAVKMAEEGETHILELHHFGDEAKLLDVFREKGLVAGLRHSFSSAKDRLFNAISSPVRFIKYAVSDPARITGTAYLMGDVLIAMAGSGVGDDKHMESRSVLAYAKRFLQEFTPGEKLHDKMKWFCGMMYIGNSAIQLAYGKDGAALIEDQLAEQFKAAQARGTDILSETFWMQDMAQGGNGGILKALEKPMRDHPIEMASAAALLGSTVGFIGGGYVNQRQLMQQHADLAKQRLAATDTQTQADLDKQIAKLKRKIQGSKDDQIAGSLSSLGWMARMVPGVKDYQQVGAMLHLTNSIWGIKAGKNLDNPYQIAGYGCYLIGEVAMFFTNRKHYGKESTKDGDLAARTIANYVEGLPLVFDDQNREKLVGLISRRIARDTIKLQTEEGAEAAASEDNLAAELQQKALKLLQEKPGKWGDLTARMQAFLHMLPEHQRQETGQALIAFVQSQPLVHECGCPDKLLTRLLEAKPILADIPASAGMPSFAVPEDALKAIVEKIPGAERNMAALAALHDQLMAPASSASHAGSGAASMPPKPSDNSAALPSLGALMSRLNPAQGMAT